MLKTLAALTAVTVSTAIALAPPALGDDPGWRIEKPSSSGIPGEEIRFLRFGPDGNIWVGARWPFWGEGGLGILDRSTGIWTDLVNWQTPIPSPYVNEIKFADDGSWWLATDGGLVHKNGATWTVYDTSNAPFLHDKVSDIDLDADGHVWVNNSGVQTSDAQILEFDGESWRTFHVGTEIPFDPPWNQLSDVVVGSDGRVWVANNVLNGLAEYDGETWTLHGAGVGRFGTIMEDLEGNLWLRAGVGGGNSFWKYDHVRFEHHPVASTPTAMAVDDDGAVFISHWNGLILRTRDGGETWQTYLDGLNIPVAITPDPDADDVWVGTLGAVGHFRGDGTWVRDYNSYNTGMPWYWVDRTTTDRDGFFWMATGEAGLSRFDGARWRNWGNHNAGAEPYPFAGNEPMGTAYQDRDGVHWFGGNGIARWHSETGTFSGFWNWQNNPGMGVGLWIYFAEDAAGNLFSAEEYGTIFRFDPEISRWVREPVQPYAVLGLPGMQADSQGNVWVAAWFDIHRWDGVEWTKIELPYRDYFFDLGGISAMAIDGDDVLWFATLDGLVRWDGVSFTRFGPENSPLPYGELRGLAVRGDGVLGMSAWHAQFEAAVTVIDGDAGDEASWTSHFYGDAPLPHWQLAGVGFDPWGDLWVSALSEGCAVLEIGPRPIPGDVNGDGIVDFDDLLMLLAAWGPCEDCPEDVDGNGVVEFDDLLLLLANWS